MKEMVVDKARVKDFQSELRALTRARHPNVVNLIGASIRDAPKVYIVMEFVPGGDLRRWIDRNVRYPGVICDVCVFFYSGSVKRLSISTYDEIPVMN